MCLFLSAGIALIDRNDELCVLYEKYSVGEAALKSGVLGLKKLDDELRVRLVI